MPGSVFSFLSVETDCVLFVSRYHAAWILHVMYILGGRNPSNSKATFMEKPLEAEIFPSLSSKFHSWKQNLIYLWISGSVWHREGIIAREEWPWASHLALPIEYLTYRIRQMRGSGLPI